MAHRGIREWSGEELSNAALENAKALLNIGNDH